MLQKLLRILKAVDAVLYLRSFLFTIGLVFLVLAVALGFSWPAEGEPSWVYVAAGVLMVFLLALGGACWWVGYRADEERAIAFLDRILGRGGLEVLVLVAIFGVFAVPIAVLWSRFKIRRSDRAPHP